MLRAEREVVPDKFDSRGNSATGSKKLPRVQVVKFTNPYFGNLMPLTNKDEFSMVFDDFTGNSQYCK
jgi:hypothetical protein